MGLSATGTRERSSTHLVHKKEKKNKNKNKQRLSIYNNKISQRTAIRHGSTFQQHQHEARNPKPKRHSRYKFPYYRFMNTPFLCLLTLVICHFFITTTPQKSFPRWSANYLSYLLLLRITIHEYNRSVYQTKLSLHDLFAWLFYTFQTRTSE